MPGIYSLIEKLKKGTKSGKVKWVATGGGFVTRLAAGRVELSNIVYDQRDGDFCYVTIYDNAGNTIESSTMGTDLHELIATKPKSDIIGKMISELDRNSSNPYNEDWGDK